MFPRLEPLDPSEIHSFIVPVKKIHDGPDVSHFLTSRAYTDIMKFVLQLNHSMVPTKGEEDHSSSFQTWPIGAMSVKYSPTVQKLSELISKLRGFIVEVPPDTGPRRYGNISFRKWYELVEQRITQLLREHLPDEVLLFGQGTSLPEQPSAAEEVQVYLLGSFGSPQRLDYGTGHELSFLAFLGSIWKVGGFRPSAPGVEERAIVLGVFQPYLELIRQLIKTYTLEPAGSHGVWGLDDNSFLPYLFGSAQLCPAIGEADEVPIEGSIPGAPEPSSVTKADLVEKERMRNMYFSAIGFIYDVKKGPFWEHSRILFDISGITAGWGKINKGMIKMYNAEVLSKFPVVQHFPFGSLFLWEKDPGAVPPPPSTHSTNQPLRNINEGQHVSTSRVQAAAGTSAPWASNHSSGAPSAVAGIVAPWAARTPKPPVGMVDGVTRAPWASRTSTSQSLDPLANNRGEPASRLPQPGARPVPVPESTSSTTAENEDNEAEKS